MLMQRLLVESDLIRRIWSNATDKRNMNTGSHDNLFNKRELSTETAFVLTKEDYKSWLTDCYGPGSETKYDGILCSRILDAVLIFSEQPDIAERCLEAFRSARKAAKAIGIAEQVRFMVYGPLTQA